MQCVFITHFHHPAHSLTTDVDEETVVLPLACHIHSSSEQLSIEGAQHNF